MFSLFSSTAGALANQPSQSYLRLLRSRGKQLLKNAEMLIEQILLGANFMTA